MKLPFSLVALILFAPLSTLHAETVDVQMGDVNDAAWGNNLNANGSPDPRVIKAQIALDRAGLSPGVIDGFDGDNFQKAIAAFQEIRALEVSGRLDLVTWDALMSVLARPATKLYTITEDDVRGNLVESVPADYKKLAEMEHIGYERSSERLAERFHMDEDLLTGLNPNVDFMVTGSKIVVADPGQPTNGLDVSRIIIDGQAGLLRAFASDGTVVVTYPATVGSEETPSPQGVHSVEGVAIDPTYSYRPDENFQQGDNDEPLTIPPGPNGPVGSVWIDLSEPTYGIHGTPSPSNIAKTNSHGCVRLTNWDAEELANLVTIGATVEFIEASR